VGGTRVSPAMSGPPCAEGGACKHTWELLSLSLIRRAPRGEWVSHAHLEKRTKQTHSQCAEGGSCGLGSTTSRGRLRR
jgi:hypothetical protein